MPDFIGYHGTSRHGAVRIEEEGFQDSPAESWLGPGIYFFEEWQSFDGAEAARWWAKTYKKYLNWVIFKVEIHSEKVLDLFASKDDRSKFKQVKQKLLEKHLENGGKEENFNLKEVFLLFSRKVEVIRGLVDAARLDRFANFVVGYPQIQLCVTKSHCIGSLVRFEE